MASRFDVCMVPIAPQKDNNGFLTVDATPTRAGIFVYHEMDNTGKIKQVKELRHPDEVFRADTLESLKGIPYTIQENHVALINPKDAQFKSFGFTRDNARQEGDHSRVSIKITHGGEIDTILGVGEDKHGKARKKMDSLELSNGYTCDVVKESGEFNGEKYDARQTNILYNHVARVDNARGGESCRIRLDSGKICGVEADRLDSEEVSEKPNGESIMKMIQRELPKVVVGDFRLDADEVEFPDEHKGVVDQLKKREKSLIKALEGASQKLDGIEVTATENTARMDVLEKENKELKEAQELSIPASDLTVHVKERSKYLKFADQYKLDSAEDMTNEDIIKNICLASKKVSDESKLDEPAYAKVVFDMLDHEHEKKKLDSKDNFDNHKVILPNGDAKKSSFDEALDSKGAA